MVSRSLSPLNPTLCRQGGADPADVELVERAAELRMASAARCIRVIDREHARLVALERERLPIPREVLSRRLEVPESRGPLIFRAITWYDDKVGAFVDHICR